MKVKVDLYEGEKAILFNDEKSFILDWYGGLPCEGQLSRIYDELPEYEMSNLLLSSKFIELDHVDRSGKCVKGVFPILHDRTGYNSLKDPNWYPPEYKVKVLFFDKTKHEMALICIAYCFRNEVEFSNMDKLLPFNLSGSVKYEDLPEYTISATQKTLKKSEEDDLEYDIEKCFIISPKLVEEKYDSTADTVKHILRINELLHQGAKNLLDRADKHDRSKLSSKEKRIFDIFTPKLKNSTYGSEEYNTFLKEMKVALDNHYTENKSHHPDLLPEGMRSMSILDLFEMVIDWKAATERHEDGNIIKSLKYNRDRFNMSNDLVKIFANTFKELGFITQEELDEINQFIKPMELSELETKAYEFVNKSIESGADLFSGVEFVGVILPDFTLTGSNCKMKLLPVGDTLSIVKFDPDKYKYIYQASNLTPTGYKYDQNIKHIASSCNYIFVPLGFDGYLQELDLFKNNKMIGV